MELSNLELVAVEEATMHAFQATTKLTDLELVMVGGGMGEVCLG